MQTVTALPKRPLYEYNNIISIAILYWAVIINNSIKNASKRSLLAFYNH